MERDQALRRVERKTDRRVNFVLTHSGYLPNVNRILKRHEHYLKEDGTIHHGTTKTKPTKREKHWGLSGKCQAEGEKRRIRPMWEKMQTMQIHEGNRHSQGQGWKGHEAGEQNGLPDSRGDLRDALQKVQ